MKISIAMATYNGAKHIEAQLQSFITQEHLPDELVVSDDDSTDGTVALVEAFAKYAPFPVIIVRNRKNLGYAGNFNVALEKTMGDIVFLSDQDDVWYPNKIAHMLAQAEQKPDYLIYMNDAALTDGNLNTVNLTKYGQIKSCGLSDEAFVMGCCCAIRRELLNFTLPIPSGLKAHDNWFVEIADGLSAKLIEREVLQYYRRHGNNESQFIANRLTRVSRLNLYAEGIKNAFSAKAADITYMQDHINLFVEGLKSANSKVPMHYQPAFSNMIENRTHVLALLKRRSQVRQASLFARIPKVVKLIISGYPKGKRLNHAVRDIIG
jgi:glycosyltransferase involved in cell wall biosynthesis